MTYDVRCHFLEGDLCSPEVRRLLLEQVMDTGMDLHVIVNNAGLGSTSPFFQVPADFYERQVMLNSAVPVMLTHALIPRMVRNGRGHILMVSSLGAFIHVPEKAVYDATKAFIAHLSQAIRPLLKERQVHLCVCFPGPVNTNQRLRQFHAGLSGLARKMVMEPGQVAEESLHALFNHRKQIIPGHWNRALNALRSILPDAWVRSIITRRLRG